MTPSRFGLPRRGLLALAAGLSFNSQAATGTATQACRVEGVPTDERNLAVRAARMLARVAGVLGGWGESRRAGETSFLGAQPSVPSEFLGEKVLGEEVSHFFLLKTKALKMFLPATKCYSRM